MSVKRFMLNVIFVVFIVHNACVNGYKTRKYRSLKFVNQQQQQQPKQYNGQIQQRITETEHIQEVEVPKQIQKIQEVNVEDVPVVQQVTQEGGQQQRIQQQDEEDDIEELIKQEDIEEEKVMNQIVKEEEPPMVMQVEQQPIVEKEESELPMLEQTESEESIQEPVVFQQDVGGEFPVIPENNVQQPVTVQEPVTVQQPTTVQQQVTVQQPTTMQQPVTVQQPIITQEPVTVQQPITVQEPVTVQQQSIEETPIPLPEEEEENETELVKLNEEISSIISELSTLSSKVEKEAIDTNPTSKFLESFSTSYYSLMDSISSKTSNANTKLEKLTKLLSQSIISQLSSQIFIINNAIILLEGKQKQLQENITKSPSLQAELDANTKRLEEYKLEKEHLENSLNSIQTLINEHIIEGDEHESTSLEPTEEMNQQIALLELLKNQLTSLYHKHEISSN